MIKRIKKTIGATLACAICLLSTNLTAFAAGDVATVTVGTMSASAGTSVTVPVSITAPTDPLGISAWSITVSYDASKVEATSITAGDFGTVTKNMANAASGSVIAGWTDMTLSNPIMTAGKLCNITFTVKNGTTGSVPVAITATDFSNSNPTQQTVKTVSGSIDVAGALSSQTVTNVTSSKADGTYASGESIPISVTFSDVVNVTGNPRLKLNTGGYATYVSGTGTNTLLFDYIVQSSDNVSDLNYNDTASLELNGGTIQDVGALDVPLTLPGLTSAGSLGTNKNIILANTVSQNNSASANIDVKVGIGSEFIITLNTSSVDFGTVTPDGTLVEKKGAVVATVDSSAPYSLSLAANSDLNKSTGGTEPISALQSKLDSAGSYTSLSKTLGLDLVQNHIAGVGVAHTIDLAFQTSTSMATGTNYTAQLTLTGVQN